MIEYKNIGLNKDSVEGRTITGYAAYFGNRDKVGDIIDPGAFKKTLKERKSRIKVYYNHHLPLGKPVVVQEDEKGLYTESRITQTARGDEVLEYIKDGVIDQMSIAYETINHEPDKVGRKLKELRLYEFGPVDFAANEKAVITGVKSFIGSLNDNIGKEDIEELKLALKRLEALLGQPSDDTVQAPLDSTLYKRLESLSNTYCEQMLSAIKI